jgi:hypothetical protein
MIDLSQCSGGEECSGKDERRLGCAAHGCRCRRSFVNLEAGMSVNEITEVFDVIEEEVNSVLHFLMQSLEKVPA